MQNNSPVFFDKHHAEPISLGWHHVQQNLMVLRQDIHKELHKKMDISSKYIREAREKLNWVMIVEPKHIEIIAWLQRRFFEWLHRLSQPVQDLHKDWARNYYNHLYKEYRDMIDPLQDNPYWLSLPNHKLIMTYDFSKLHDQMTDVRKAMSYANVQLIRYKALEHYTKKNGRKS